MARPFSTAWWNVIRRRMNATEAREDRSVRCPDCDGPMHLMRGRYGRFYRCWRYECLGTVGARLDGTPRKPKGSPELLEARARATKAMSFVVRAREEIEKGDPARSRWKTFRSGWDDDTP